MPERGADAGYGVDAACLPDDAPAVVRLWGEALGRVEKRQQKLQWFYAHPGRERARLFVLRHTGEIVGATGIGPRSLWWRGSSVDAALMGDFAVASRHRTLYPAMLLQRSTLQQGLQEYALLYGFPNARSLPVVRRVGYQVLPGMARYARMLRSSFYLPSFWPAALRRAGGALLDRLLGLRHALALMLPRRGLHTAWLHEPDARFDALWLRLREQVGDCVIGVRDCALLRWRFPSHTARQPRFFVLSDRQGERLLGYAVCQPNAQASALQILDLLVDAPSPACVARLLRLLAETARAQGYRSLSVQCGGPDWLLAGVRAAGLVPRQSTQREPMILALAPGMPQEMATVGWYLSYADTDE